MSARDNLSPMQFPVEKLGEMPSQWGSGKTNEEIYQNPADRFDAVEDKYARNKGFNSAREYHEHLVSDIRDNGVQTPLHVSEGAGRWPRIINGHHRFFAARDLGLTEVPVHFSA